MSFVNPYGVSLVLFPIELLSRSEILSHVIEWQSPDFRSRWGIALALWICVFIAAVARGRHRVSRRDLIVTVPMLLLALWALRNIAVAPLIGLPVVAHTFAVETDAPERFSKTFLAAATAAIVVIGADGRCVGCGRARLRGGVVPGAVDAATSRTTTCSAAASSPTTPTPAT